MLLFSELTWACDELDQSMGSTCGKNKATLIFLEMEVKDTKDPPDSLWRLGISLDFPQIASEMVYKML